MAIARGAVDVLSLGTGWEPQSDSGGTTAQRETAADSKGDIAHEDTFGEVEEKQATYIYTGAETDIADAALAATVLPGFVKSGYLVMRMDVAYADCASGKKPKVTFGFRDGLTTSDHYYVPSITLPSYADGGVEVPELLDFVASGEHERRNASYSLAVQFEPDADISGDPLDGGETYGGEETVTHETVGVITLAAVSGWIMTSGKQIARDNRAYPAETTTHVKGVTRTAIPA